MIYSHGQVYLATNRVNGKVYVGQTCKSLDDRKARHMRHARQGRAGRFQQAIRKYGEDAFEFRTLVVGPAGDWLDKIEMSLISAYGSFGRGYNACAGGTGTKGVIRKGRVVSSETRAKISATQKVLWATRPGTFLGREHTAEARAKIGDANRGKVFSEEHRAKLSESHKGKHHAGTFKPGHRHSEEARRRMSETRKGVPKTGQGLENIRAGCAKRRGSTMSAESRAKLSASRLLLPIVECPHCAKTGRQGGGMSKYHFDNCKKRGS